MMQRVMKERKKDDTRIEDSGDRSRSLDYDFRVSYCSF